MQSLLYIQSSISSIGSEQNLRLNIRKKSILNYKNLYNPTLLSKIPTYGSKLSVKSLSIFRVYYKNINSLPSSSKLLKFSCKYKLMQYLLCKLDTDVILLTETQINSKLIDKTYDIPSKIFTSEVNVSICSSNIHKLIRKR